MIASKNLTALLLTLMALQASAQHVGIGLPQAEKFEGYKRLSMMGGAQLWIKSENGLARDPANNQITYQSFGIQGLGPITAPPLSDNDVFNSNPQDGILSFTTQSVMELFRADFDDFNGAGLLPSGNSSPIELYTSTKNLETQMDVNCKSELTCFIGYSRMYTPILYDVVPNQMYKDQYSDFWVNVQKVHSRGNTPADHGPVEELRIDGALTNYELTIDQSDRLNTIRLDRLTTVITDQKPSKQSVPRARFFSGDSQIRNTARHCNFAGDDCWTVRTHAKIESVSANQGNTNGGQELKLTGWGFEKNVDITVAGVPCTITEQKMDEVTCVTGAAAGPSTDGVAQPGQPGLARRKYNPTDDGQRANIYSIDSHPLESENLELVFETAHDNDINYGNLWDGYFKAPATGEYRFYLSCDDACRLNLDSTNDLASGLPFSPVQIANNWWDSGWRGYLDPPQVDSVNQYISDWIPLTQDQYYKIDAEHAQYTSGAHFTVSVEFKDAAAAGHKMATKETQVMFIDQTNEAETWQVIVNNPSSGLFKLIFQDPSSLKFIQTEDFLTADISAGDFEDRIYKPFYKDTVGSTTTVTKTTYDVNGVETNVASDIVQAVYTVVVDKRLSGQSYSNIQVMNDPSSTSTISVIRPNDIGGQASSAPLDGSYIITCSDPANPTDSKSTREIIYYEWGPGIEHIIYEDIPFLASKVTVKDLGVPNQSYWQNARRFAIIFTEFDQDVPQCTLSSGVNSPITGNNVQLLATTLREYGANLFFEPVPMEMLYTAVTKPQILVNVEGMPAACANLNCDYLYVDSTAQVTGQSLAGNQITVDGVNFPTEILDVRVGGVGCGPVTGTATQIVCTLAQGPAAGTYAEVEVLTADGLVPVGAAVPPIVVTLIINSVTPSTGLQDAGGDILTIVGQGLPVKAQEATVVFSDNTNCEVQSSSDTQLVCKTEGFETATIDYVNPYGVTVAVGAVQDNGLTVSIVAGPYNAVSIEPTSASPVLKQDLYINMAGGFPDISAELDQWTVTITNAAGDYTRELYIKSWDDINKRMVTKFNGAPSDIYTVQVEGPMGFVKGGPFTLTTKLQVDSISPLQGSVLGGTLLTITGAHFGEVATDNPVKVGDNYCLVLDSQDTQITCRIDVATSQVVATAEVIVFAKAAEEMVCNDGQSCLFQYVASTTTVSNIGQAFNSADNTIEVTVDGTGFPIGDVVGTELYIDGKKQQTKSVTATQAKFKLIDALNVDTYDIQFYTAEGRAQGDLSQLLYTPGLVSVSPQVGSSGGTYLTVTGVGFGEQTQDLNLFHVPSGQNICSEVDNVSYGSFGCQTIALTISNADELKLVIGGSQYACLNTLNAAECFLTQELASSPQQTNVFASSTEIVQVTVANIPAGWSASCSFKGVEATGVVLPGNLIGCAFPTGVPASDTPEAVQVVFSDPGSSVRVTADSNGQTLTNPLTVGANSPVTCSYEGGCAFTVDGNGLAGLLAGNPANKITVCGEMNECEVDVAASSGSQMVCKVPSLITSFSANAFDMVEPSNLSVTWTGTGLEMFKLNDGVNTVSMTDNTATNCYAEVSAQAGYIYSIDEIKIFLNNLIDKAPYIDGNLKIQGSNDGVTFTDIHSYDASIHEGWNSVDWRDPANPQVYRTIRLQGAVSGSCMIGEVKLIGVEVLDESNPVVPCTAKLTIDGVTTDLAQVTYSDAATPSLTAVTGVSPRFGSVLGSEQVTFTGTGFTGTATVFIDDRPCTVDSQTATQIVCTTSSKPTIVASDPSLEIMIDGVGKVATRGLVFRYVSLWSEPQTWGYDAPPLEGQAVEVPKGQHLLVDVASTPKLSFVVVYGSLIFAPNMADPTDQKTFDAEYIMVNGGYLEIGTEDFPYTSRLTITMHGNQADPALPIYGNKVIAVRYGQLEMHGAPRSVVWTDLKTTATAGSSTITLNDITGAPLDWAMGEKIVIASTDLNGEHAEERTIVSVTNADTNPVITLDRPLVWEHYAGAQQFGADTIEMRAEVGLLSRNVVYRGDPQTSQTNQYGAHIMLHSPGDESVIGRIENCEFTDVGQAFKLGRYPLHFHMIGTVQKSYIKKNSIHQTYNRATTLHGVHYLEISGNVAYKAMGHTIFIEDAIETNNLIENNLIVDTRASNSLLNTDQTPACFWITHPNNIFRGNHAAGSARYGYWFDLQETSIGPSFDPNVCPENEKLGEFSDNVSHSCGRYGLRIFHNLIPRTFPCSPLVADMTNPADPYHENPVIPARFYRHLSYKNGRNGAIAERVGAVEFIDFKTADNVLAGIEMSLTEDVIDGYANVIGGVIVGRSANTEADIDAASPHGIIGPRSEGFSIDGTKFFNYDFNQAAALGDCSHCFHPASTDSGARTIKTNALQFTSVTRRIKYQYPWRGIFHDQDGSLTGLGADTYATINEKYVQQPECTLDDVLYNGVVCDSSVKVKRIAWYGYKPDHFRGMNMNILKYDSADIKAMTDQEKADYIADGANYSNMFWKEKLKPSNTWALPWVTGHGYRVTWANDLDYTQMKVMLSDYWAPGDLNTFFVLPFVDAREAINVTDTATGDQIMDKTLLDFPIQDWETGYNLLQNQTDIREFQFVVNGAPAERKELKLEGLQCISGTCPQAAVVVVPIDPNAKFWSQAASWPSGQLPQAGEDVEIIPGMNMVLDIETPELGLVTINGRLSFYDAGQDIALNAKQVYVRGGELLIGSESEPFQSNAEIKLLGERSEATTIMSGSIETGNKLIVNTGLVSMHGKARDRFSRLHASVFNSQDMAIVEPGLDWVPGDRVYFAPTNHQWLHSEYKTIVTYDSSNGLMTVDTPFEFYHFGDSESTAADYKGLDMRGEVRLLTRNVRIYGDNNNEDWGGNILTMDRVEFDGSVRIATTKLDNIELEHMSQKNTFHAAIRFEQTGQSRESYVKNTVVHHSPAWALYVSSSSDILIQDSDFIGAKAVGVNLISAQNVIVDGIFVADVTKRVWEGGDNTLDKEACVAFCSYWEPNRCFNTVVKNSIAAGCAFAGFIAPGDDCDQDEKKAFFGNVAHSSERAGAHIYPDPASGSSSRCYQGRDFMAYKNRDGGLTTMYKSKDQRMSNMVFVDNEKGVCLQTAGEGEQLSILMENVDIYGEMDNTDAPNGQRPYCKEKYGLMLFGSNRGGKPLHPTMQSQLPVHKIKSYGSWGGEVNLINVNFHNFMSATTMGCGETQHAIQRNDFASDYIPPHKFTRTTFYKVSDPALIFLRDPNPGWANPTDCIEWPCTAPENVVLHFEQTDYQDSTILNTDRTFVIVSDVEDAVRGYQQCELVEYWSAAFCTNRNIGILLFESLDADNEDRTIQPVVITNDVTGYINRVNSMMDHMWDGFYTGQKRLSRFPAQIETIGDYTVQFTGTPANSIRYVLRAEVGGIKIKVPYPNAGSYTVYANGNEMPYTPWDSNKGRHAELTKSKGCGENRYVGVENFLEFYINTDCEIRVEPRNSIMVSVRLDWTLESFYEDGGVTTFTDRMASVLGVHSSQIKTVAVYEGSVIVEFFVDAEPDDEEPEMTLKQAEQRFIDAVNSGTMELGAPIIDAMSNNKVLRTGYISDEEQSKDGNIWDDLERDKVDPVIGSNDPNDQAGISEPNSSSSSGSQQSQGGNQGSSGSASSNSGEVELATEEGSSPEQGDSNTSRPQQATVVTEVIKEPAITDSVKYLIVFLAVLTVALVVIIAYIAMKMCTRRHVKLPRKPSETELEPQFAVNPDEAKDIFQNGRKKVNGADQLGEATSAGARSSSTPQIDQVEAATEEQIMRSDPVAPDTEREMISARR